MKIIYFSVLIMLCLASFHCRDKQGDWVTDPTNVVILILSENGVLLSDSMIASIKASILINGEKSYDPQDIVDATTKNAILDDSLYVYPYDRLFDAASANNGIMVITSYVIKDNFKSREEHPIFLEFPDGRVDTLTIYAERVSNEAGLEDKCTCTIPVRETYINGKPLPTIDKNLRWNVYAYELNDF